MIKTGQTLADLANEIIQSGAITAEQAKMLRLHIFSETRIMERMFEDGLVDRKEAETLFSINDALQEGLRDDYWRELFVEAVTSHVLKDDMSPSTLDEEEARFIINGIERDGKVDALELELLVNLAASVTSAPPVFHSFVLAALKNDIIKQGFVDERRAQMIERAIYGMGSSSGKSVDEMERLWLGEIDEVTEANRNHSAWNILKLKLNVA